MKYAYGYFGSNEFHRFCLSRLNDKITKEYLYEHLNLLHASLGIVGEAQEVSEALTDFKNYKNSASFEEDTFQEKRKALLLELGDVLFYLSIIKFDFGINTERSLKKDGFFDLQNFAIQFAELIKKYVFQQRVDLEKEIEKKLADIFLSVYGTAKYLDEDIAELEKTCTEKLTARYPKKFTPEQSLNRKV